MVKENSNVELLKSIDGKERNEVLNIIKEFLKTKEK